MPKYFFAPEAINHQQIRLEGDTAHHLLHVLRVKPGQRLWLCDGKLTDYHCRIEQVYPQQHSLLLSIEEVAASQAEPALSITLYQSLPKLDKMEWVIQKSVELGVHKIVPVITTHTVSRPKDVEAKTERFRKIAQSAAEQSMRGIIPQISTPVSFASALADAPEVLQVAAYENERHTTLRQVLKSAYFDTMGLWIGPEGGFSEGEVKAFQDSQVKAVTLGPRILRTETAGMAAIIQTLCIWEDKTVGKNIANHP